VGTDVLLADVRLRLQILTLQDVTKRHVPPTLGDDGVLSPTLSQLITKIWSSQNAQMFDQIGLARYLAEYTTVIVLLYYDKFGKVHSWPHIYLHWYCVSLALAGFGFSIPAGSKGGTSQSRGCLRTCRRG